MRPPVTVSTIERRLLVNFRADPDAVAAQLPPGMRPQLVQGAAVAGLCLIRLSGVRPRGTPARLGIGCENAAHRYSVEHWRAGSWEPAVYIPRRETSSSLVAFGGSRSYGPHHKASFVVDETEESIAVAIRSFDGRADVNVRGSVTDALPTDSLFSSTAEVGNFFAAASCGYSPTASGHAAVRLTADSWAMTPVAITEATSSYFADISRFPAGALDLDSAVVMRNIGARWEPLEDLAAVAGAA